MPYLIDTDILIDRIGLRDDALSLFDAIGSDGIAMSIISYIELYQGIFRAPDRTAAEAEIEGLVAITPILAVSVAIARRCAEIRHQLQSAGKRTHRRALDLIIAATAIEHGLTLVTRNVADYDDVPGVQLYQ